MAIIKLFSIFISNFLFICIIDCSFSIIIFDNDLVETIKLENNNILVITKNRLYLVDPYFSIIINQTNYSFHYNYKKK